MASRVGRRLPRCFSATLSENHPFRDITWVSSFCEFAVLLEEEGDALGVVRELAAVGFLDGAVQLAVGCYQLGRHGEWVVEVGQAAVRVLGAGIQNSLGQLRDLLLLRLRAFRLGEVVVEYICRISVVALQSSGHSADPSHMHG